MFLKLWALRKLNSYHNYNTSIFFSSDENLEFGRNSISTIEIVIKDYLYFVIPK